MLRSLDKLNRTQNLLLLSRGHDTKNSVKEKRRESNRRR